MTSQDTTFPTDPAPGGRDYLEALELWQAGSKLWLDYLCGLPAAGSLSGWMNLNSQFFADSLQLAGSAAGGLLRDEGLPFPLLNDA